MTEKVYFLIQLFEENAFNKGPLLTLRVDRMGEYGELVWIQRGIILTGQIMLNLCLQFIDYLKISSVYLMDSASINLVKIPFPTKHESKEYLKRKKAFLRLLHVLTSIEGKSWYHMHAEFKPIDIEKWPLIPRNAKKHSQIETICQNIEKYQDSVTFVRNFKLKQICKYLPDEQRLHIEAMIEYYLDFAFDHDTAQKMKKQKEKSEYECKQNRYSKRAATTTKKRQRSRSRSRERNRIRAESDLELTTVHDLCRRVHVSALYAPSKWRKNLGLRHLRILYDILIDPSIATKFKNNGFLKDEMGKEYLQSLEQIMNVRVFCKGKHPKQRIEGVFKAKQMTQYTLNKFYREFVEMVDFYQKQRSKQREKYKMFVDRIDDARMRDDEDESEDDGNEIELSLKFKNKNNTNYKHQICIDSDSQNNINIRVKSQSKKTIKSKLSPLDRLKEPNPTRSRKRRRSKRVSRAKRRAVVGSDEDI